MSTVNALVAAARDGDVGQIKTLAQQCDINARDEIGWCAVHRAAVHGQVQSLRCLVASGAELDAVDDDGWRAIHRAAWVGDCPTLKALVELGAGVETACDATGETAVHVAARNGRLKALRCLATELGANVAARDAFGRTAAHFAAWEGHVHILRSLKSLGDLARDADDGGDALLVARDRDGRLPVDYADDRGARDAAAWLRALAARKTPGGAAPPPPSAPASQSTPAPAKGPAPRTATSASARTTPASARAATPRSPPMPPPPPLDAAERARAALMASQLVAELQLTDQKADALAAHLVAARGFATFEELLDPELLDDLEALGPYGLLDVPRKKLAQRRQWWSRGEESISPDIGPAIAALGLT
jgi:hypothetical protein